MTGVAVAEADKLCEAQGLDAFETERARERTVSQAHWLYDEQGQHGGYDGGGRDGYRYIDARKEGGVFEEVVLVGVMKCNSPQNLSCRCCFLC